MNELLNTRNNPMIDPSLQIWGWEIPVYLFLGGLVAGMMIINGYFLIKRSDEHAGCSYLFLPWFSVVLLSLGMFALFLDLEYKAHFWRLYVTFEVLSPMSWGAWILLLVYPAILLSFFTRPPKWFERLRPTLSSNLRTAMSRFKNRIGVANMILGSLLGVYTGILLSSLSARPLWSSAVLGLLFLTSGLSTAAATVHLLARDVDERELLARTDNYLLAAELILILLFIVGHLSAGQAQQAAIMLLITGPYAAAFWIFVVSMGLVVPLIIQPLAVRHRIPHTPIAPILVIVGGLVLRFVLVYAGQESNWTTVF